MRTTLSMYFWDVSITQLGLVHIIILFNSLSCNNVLSVILCIFHTCTSFFLFDDPFCLATLWLKQDLSSSLLDKSWVVDLPLNSQFYSAWTLPLEASQATSLDAGRESRKKCFCVSGWQAWSITNPDYQMSSAWEEGLTIWMCNSITRILSIVHKQ